MSNISMFTNSGRWISPEQHKVSIHASLQQWRVLRELAQHEQLDHSLTLQQRMCLLRDADPYHVHVRSLIAEVEVKVQLEQAEKDWQNLSQDQREKNKWLWACMICTFHNPYKAALCEICGSHRGDSQKIIDLTSNVPLEEEVKVKILRKEYQKCAKEAASAREILVQTVLSCICGGTSSTEESLSITDVTKAAREMAEPQLPVIERAGHRPPAPPVTIAWQRVGLHFVPLVPIKHSTSSPDASQEVNAAVPRRWDMVPETVSKEFGSKCCLQATDHIELGEAVPTRVALVGGYESTPIIDIFFAKHRDFPSRIPVRR